jgi:DNA-directed RNA polymerase specialized sigma24 family protein
MSFDVRDAVVDELVYRSRSRGGAWTVGLAGVLLPGLRRAVWPLVQACPGKAADIEAETLAAFLAAVARCEPGRARLASRLCWLARIGADRLLRAEVAERARPGTDPVSAAPRQPWGHPDLVLERAVRTGVIGAADAELIGATRIGDVELAEVAKTLGISYKACHQRRRRAESALVEWLTSDNYGDIAFDATNRRSRSRQSVPEQGRRGRPRQGERVVGQRV